MELFKLSGNESVGTFKTVLANISNIIRCRYAPLVKPAQSTSIPIHQYGFSKMYSAE